MPLSLYIDETGNFDTAFSHNVAICGLLADDVLHRNLADWLRPEAVAFAPEIPWPWHAAHLNRAVMWALWHDALPNPANSAAFWREPAQQLADLLRRYVPQEWRQAIEAIRAGKRPKIDLVKTIENAAWTHDPESLAELGKRREDVLTFLNCCLAEVAAQAGSAPAVFAAESVPTADTSRTDRYLALLPVAIGRAVDLAMLDPANAAMPVELRLHVLGRDVRDPVAGVGVDLHERHLHEASAAATQSRTRTRTRGKTTVRVVPVEVAEFDDNAHASFVLADRLANSANRALRKASGKSHAQLAAALHRQTGILINEAPLRSPIAAGQPAQGYIDHHRGTGEHPRADAPDLHGCRPWAAEQARAWAEELA